MTANWQNRIVGYVVKPASQFQAHPLNFRLHPKAQQEAMRGSLNDLGWIDVVLENVRTGHLIDGHERIFEALALGDDTPVPCLQIDIAEAEEPQALLMLDPIAAMAQIDKSNVDALLREVHSGEAGVQAMLGKLAQDAGIVKFDPMSEWDGMPEFEHEDQTADAAFTIRVFLKDADDLAAFSRLLGKDLTGKKFVWFGKQPLGDLYEVYDESPS